MEKLILIDGSGLIYRGFYAIPPFLKSPNGIQTNAVFGFTNILLALLTHYKPSFLAVALDKKGPTFRHKEFESYKATRVKAPQELYDQIPLVKNVVGTFRIPSFEMEGYEADDIIATIVKKLSTTKELETLIATADFDIFQVISGNTAILYPAKGFKDAEILRAKDITEKYGLSPEQIPDYKGIAGDSSDNLPGVRGIGEKGAKDLLHKYKTLDNIYKHLDECSQSIRERLKVNRDNAFLSRKLATLDHDVPLDFDLNSCRVKDFDVNSVRKLFGEFGFKSLQKRIDELYGTEVVQRSLF